MLKHKNKICNIDCLEFMKQTPNNFFDLIFADPPYRFTPHGRGLSKDREYLCGENGVKGIGTSGKFDLYSSSFLDECLRIIKIPNIFLFCNKMQILDILNKAAKENLNFEILVFCKTAPTPLCNNQWMPDKEYGIHLYKKNKVRGNYHTKKTFYVDTNYKDKNINHPTPKPIKIIENLLKNLTEKHYKVFDPFMGSGTTALACKILDIDFWGCEISEKYIKVANNRLKKVCKSFNFEE